MGREIDNLIILIGIYYVCSQIWMLGCLQNVYFETLTLINQKF